MTNKLLQNEHARISTEVAERVASASSVAILCDGWTNVRNEPILNFVVTIPTPVFWSSVSTSSDSHTGEFMAEQMRIVIEEVGPAKVLGVCTDNASNMKKAWSILNEQYPHIICYGCLAHGLNLIFTDIMKLKTLSKTVSQCVALVKHIKYSHKLSATLRQIQQSSKCTSKIVLQLPVKTRWGSIVHCLTSLASNKQSLKSLAIDESVKSNWNQENRNNILSDVFWDQVEGFIIILKPIARAITLVESNAPLLSTVMKLFKNMEDELKANVLISPLMKKEETDILNILISRKDFATQAVHYAANVLDPKLKGKNLSPSEKVRD